MVDLPFVHQYPPMALSGTDPLVWRTDLHDVSDPFVAVDQDGAIVEFNRAAERLFGHSRDEAVGRGSSLLLAEHDREANPTGLVGLLGAGADPVLGRRAQRRGGPRRRLRGGGRVLNHAPE